jgi:RNA polymerase sigma-70 factor (ECF subfamily)
VFLKVWRAFGRYDGRASVGTWIYAIARNTALSWLRSQSYRRTVPLESIADPPAAALSADADRDIRKCVERLPPDQQQIVELYYFQDRSIDAVSEIVRMAPGTVKSHLFRARRALADMLGEGK